jgi:hypothetical protein
MNSYSFFVNNTGATNSAKIKVQISPDNSTWVDDGSDITIAHNTAYVTTANKFLRYIRVAYMSATGGASTTLSIIFQGQS